ncbi:GntR family transcriptional regulator [Streptomyces canus]|uniref:FadR/GntR family transcriptional regulator n=1 Tax=Streptomyces canus TaxID=58343 RepID=UPI00340A27B6
MTADSFDHQAFRRVERGRIADHIMEDLRSQILLGVLPDGSRLPAERELAERYGVSGATVREAVRVLTAMGLVSVRHGSGSFVTASADRMIAVSIASAIQLENVGASEVLDVLGTLHARAVQTAAVHAADEEIAALREAAEHLAVIESVEQAVHDLKRFLHLLSEVSHNALLATLCRFFGDIQVELGIAISGGPALHEWKRVAGALYQDRLAVVEALEARDGDRAAALVRTYHQRARELITATPQAEEIQISDPRFSKVIASLLSTRPVAGPR